MRSIRFASFLVLAATGVIAACHDSSEPPKSTDMASTTPMASSSSSAMATPMPSMTASAAPMPSASADAKPALSDGEIAAVESAANQGEITMAQLASKTSKNAQVKTFATMMITQHTDADTKAKKIGQTAQITPTDNPTSAKLKADNDATMATLKTQKGADFDKTYMDAQVKGHQDVLTAIDEKLMPSVKNADLKTHLGEVRTHVVHHLEKAKEISSSLGGAKP